MKTPPQRNSELIHTRGRQQLREHFRIGDHPGTGSVTGHKGVLGTNLTEDPIISDLLVIYKQEFDRQQ
jgi:hypothetical protein